MPTPDTFDEFFLQNTPVKHGPTTVDVGPAPSGYGDMYDQLFANNPYRNRSYNRGWLQSILSNMGFRTKYDDFREQMEYNAAEFDAGIFSMMQQNQYNSPEAQAARMRNAGLNPDLLGTGDVESAASPAEDPNGISPSATEAPDALSLVSTVSSGVLGIIPKVLSFATNLSQMKGIRIENDAKELSFGSAAVDAASKFFLEGITENDYKDAFQSGNWDNILSAAKKDSSYLAETMFSSPSARKRFKLAYGMHSNGLISKMQKYKTYDEFEKYRKSLLNQRASTFFDDNDETMESLLSSFLGPLEAYQKRMNDINLKRAQLRESCAEQGLENLQIANQIVYEATIDAAGQASAENAANTAQQQQNEIMEATNSLFAEIMNSLKGNDNWWSKIAMALVGIARAQLLSGLSIPVWP